MPDHQRTEEWVRLSGRATFHRAQISPPVFLKNIHYPWNLSLALYFLSQSITSAYLRNEKLEAIVFARALLLWSCLVFLMKTLIYDGAITEGWKNGRRKMEGGKGEKRSKREWFAGLASSVCITFLLRASRVERKQYPPPPPVQETIWASHLGMLCSASAACIHRQTRESLSWLIVAFSHLNHKEENRAVENNPQSSPCSWLYISHSWLSESRGSASTIAMNSKLNLQHWQNFRRVLIP